MRPSTSSAANGGCFHCAGSPSVTTSVWPSSNSVGPAVRSPSTASTLGRPGATGCTSTSKPSWRNHCSTCAATAASVAAGSPGRTTLGMRMRSRVSAISSSGSTRASADLSADTGQPRVQRLLVREGQDHGVEPDHAVLLEGDVEIVPLDLLRTLLERDHRLELRHLAKGVGAFVEPVAAGHHRAVADRRALRTVHADVGRRFGHHLDEEIDAVDLDGDVRHIATIPRDISWLDAGPLRTIACRERWLCAGPWWHSSASRPVWRSSPAAVGAAMETHSKSSSPTTARTTRSRSGSRWPPITPDGRASRSTCR